MPLLPGAKARGPDCRKLAFRHLVAVLHRRAEHMSDGDLIGLSGWRRDDAAATFRAHNIATAILADNASGRTLARRLKMLSAWLLESAEAAEGVSSEDLGMLDAARFWKARANGARG